KKKNGIIYMAAVPDVALFGEKIKKRIIMYVKYPCAVPQIVSKITLKNIHENTTIQTNTPNQKKLGLSSQLFYCILKSFTCFECRYFRCCNLDFFSRLWIASFSSRAFTHFEVTEADKLYFFTFFQRFLDRVKYCINCSTCFFFCKISIITDCIDQICFVHQIHLLI